MQFGISLIVRGRDATLASVRELVERAETGGYHSVWSSDHIVLPEPRRTRFPGRPDWRIPGHWYEGYLTSTTVLAYAAACSRRVLVGTSALVLPLRHPVLLAKEAATLDSLSGGRLVLAVAAGYARDEFDALGIPFEGRGARTDEYLAVCRAVWSPDPVTFTGPTISFSGLHCRPKPIGPLPVFVGGWSDAARRRAARLGDGWHPASLTPEQLAPRLERFQQEVARADRPERSLPVWVKAPLGFGDAGGPEVTLRGDARTMVDTIRRYEDLGVEVVVLDWAEETLVGARVALDRFEAEVRPRL